GQSIELTKFDTFEKVQDEVLSILLQARKKDLEPSKIQSLLAPLFEDISTSEGGVELGEDVKQSIAGLIAKRAKAAGGDLFVGGVGQDILVEGASSKGRGKELGTEEAQGQFLKVFFTDAAQVFNQPLKDQLEELGKDTGQKLEVLQNLFDLPQDTLKNLAASFKDLSDDAIEGLPKQIDRLTDSLIRLQEALPPVDEGDKAKPPVKPAGGLVAEGNALGGPIFRRQGTDTVPAMLTPGEFVVNRAAAQQNMGLLTAINKSDGSGAMVRDGVTFAAK
ncbi:unnamed protein product, partial [marine sediment metagenome]